jgi:hypothetical protein
MGYAIIGVVILAIVALIALPMITDNQATIEAYRAQQERERTEQAYARVAQTHANNQAWLYFSEAMFPWFATVTVTVFGAVLLLGLLTVGMVVGRAWAARPQQPTIYVIADNRRAALARLGSYDYLPERPEQIVFPTREEVRLLKDTDAR